MATTQTRDVSALTSVHVFLRRERAGGVRCCHRHPRAHEAGDAPLQVVTRPAPQTQIRLGDGEARLQIRTRPVRGEGRFNTHTAQKHPANKRRVSRCEMLCSPRITTTQSQ